MGKEITDSEELTRYLRRLGYATEGNDAPLLAALSDALIVAAGGSFPFLAHQVRDGVRPLEAPTWEKPSYRPWLSWFLVTGGRGHQQVFCEDVRRTARIARDAPADKEP